MTNHCLFCEILVKLGHRFFICAHYIHAMNTHFFGIERLAPWT